jgi:hypothetical protein
MLSHLADTMSGSTTIRVYGRANEFTLLNTKHLNNHIAAMQMQQGVNSWFAIRIDMLSVLLMAIISSACVLLR